MTDAIPIRPSLLEDRLPGERYWWIDGQGRVLVSNRQARVVGDATAEGRVCVESGIGVIERIEGRVATLGLLAYGTVDLLAQRFEGVRWAIADAPPMSGTLIPYARSA